MKNIDSDLIRGNIDTIILKTMLDGDKYGLDIIKEVEARSNGTYELKQPTLYSCLKRLENQELISSYWLDSDIGGRRHYYKLTEKGHETLEKKQEEWAKSKFIIDNLLSNYNYDEYRLVKKDDYDKIIEGKEFVYNQPASAPEETAAAPAETSNQSENEDDENYELINNESDLEDFHELSSNESNENYHDLENEESEENNSDTEDNTLSDENDSFETDEDNDEDSEDLDNFTDTQINRDIFDEEENHEDDAIDVSTEIDESDRFYFSYSGNEEEDDDEDENNSNEIDSYSLPDQSNFESNILANLRKQEDEEINTYYGDHKSYLNHLSMSEEDDDYDVVQQNILDMENTSLSESVDEKLSEFSLAIEELNNFNSASDEEPENDKNTEETIEETQAYDIETTETETADNSFEEDQISFDDDFENELSVLNQNKNNGFFNSVDNPDYEVSSLKTQTTSPDNYDYSETDSSDSAYEIYNTSHEEIDENDYTFSVRNETIEDDDNSYDYSFSSTETVEQDETEKEENTNPYDFDSIISNNVNSFSSEYSSKENSTFTSFTPKFTSENYKQKLSNLSMYSKVTDENEPQKEINEDALNKAKDIDALKEEFEKEGIKIKEFRKFNSSEQSEKTYLLSNKMKMVNSLILLFGYVFLLSAVYIILNNTNFKNTFNFSFKYFLYGFIPFGVYALYHLIMFIVNPYKKVPAKLAPRILIFISLIITIQLLLITYCVNLQLGFYSFTQAQYNHLLWVIPTILSFAPIVANVIYISLFYSKNFNV